VVGSRRLHVRDVSEGTCVNVGDESRICSSSRRILADWIRSSVSDGKDPSRPNKSEREMLIRVEE